MPLGHQREQANAYIDGMAAVVNDTANSISDEFSQPARYVLKSIWLRMQEVNIIRAIACQTWFAD
jgi:hypothetical protein